MTPLFVTTSRRMLTAGLALVALQVPVGTATRTTIPNDERAIDHALNRLAFGARRGDTARIQHLTLAAWIDQQLSPGRRPDPTLDARLERLTILSRQPEDLARDFIAVRQERRRRQQQANGGKQASAPSRAMSPMNPDMRRSRQVVAELAEAKLVRAIYSERQLEEVLVDFWFNHFNVFARKGQTEIYVGEYERESIRPHVLGNFRDLLGSTARSPAMLVYLDNWMSADPDAASRPQTNPSRRAGDQASGRRSRMGGITRGPAPRPRRMRGLNENYARELLELHTLGVDGGYTQQDVVDVARAFTGWTIGGLDDPGFRFVPAMHDRGAKKVLGHSIQPGRGIEDGEQVLDILASHPATARHVAFKLTQRFVSDMPPDGLVERAAAVFTSSHGDLREVVRAIVTSSEFFAPDAHRAKVKTPFEFVVSALRTTGADVRSGQSVVRALAAMGMPLYLCQPPTGYDEAADTWVSSGALVNRMNFALALSGGQMRGIVLEPFGSSVSAASDRIVGHALAGDASQSTRATLARATTVEQAVALIIGSPEFQRQ